MRRSGTNARSKTTSEANQTGELTSINRFYPACDTKYAAEPGTVTPSQDTSTI